MSDGLKMVMISYNSAIEVDVIEILEKGGIKNYTKWTGVNGKGQMSGSHFGSEVWPGINSVIFSAMEAEKAQDLIKHIKGLRAKLGKEGVKAFCWSLEEMT